MFRNLILLILFAPLFLWAQTETPAPEKKETAKPAVAEEKKPVPAPATPAPASAAPATPAPAVPAAAAAPAVPADSTVSATADSGAATETAVSTAKSVAVLDLEVEGFPAGGKKPISDKLRADLMATGGYVVMERGKMEDIMKEQGFQLSGAVDDESKMLELGKMLGVKLMVAGSIGKLGKLTLINLRMIDIETGKIVKTVSQDCRCEIENLPMAISIVAKKLAGLDVTEELAQLNAIAAKTRKENKKVELQEKKEDAEIQAIATGAKKSSWPWIAGTVALLGGGGVTAWLLLGGDDGKPGDAEDPVLDAPGLPPIQN